VRRGPPAARVDGVDMLPVGSEPIPESFKVH
jgi:hypothetical protein